MLPPPDPRTIEGQLRICHNQSAMATLAIAIDVVAQFGMEFDRVEYSEEEVANLLRLMNTVQIQVEQAREAARAYAGMVMPCVGSV